MNLRGASNFINLETFYKESFSNVMLAKSQGKVFVMLK